MADTGRRSRPGNAHIATTAAILLAGALLSATAPPASAAAHIVGGKKKWAEGVNFTLWAESDRFYVHDWLIFYYRKGYYGVVQVNETAFESCDTDLPILNYTRGNSFAMELNRTGKYYFTTAGGYCWHGMKLAINVEPLPPPAPTPAPAPAISSAAELEIGLTGFVLGWVFLCGGMRR